MGVRSGAVGGNVPQRQSVLCVILQQSCALWPFHVVGMLSCQHTSCCTIGSCQVHDSCFVTDVRCWAGFASAFGRVGGFGFGYVQDGWATRVDEASSNFVPVEYASNITLPDPKQTESRVGHWLLSTTNSLSDLNSLTHHFIAPHSHLLIRPRTILLHLILISSHLSNSSSHLHTTKLKSPETVRAASAILGLEQYVCFFCLWNWRQHRTPKRFPNQLLSIFRSVCLQEQSSFHNYNESGI